MEKYYTIKEFADAVGVAVITVRMWIKLGKIIAEKKRVTVGFKEVWTIPQSEISKVKQ